MAKLAFEFVDATNGVRIAKIFDFGLHCGLRFLEWGSGDATTSCLQVSPTLMGCSGEERANSPREEQRFSEDGRREIPYAFYCTCISWREFPRPTRELLRFCLHHERKAVARCAQLQFWLGGGSQRAEPWRSSDVGKALVMSCLSCSVGCRSLLKL